MDTRSDARGSHAGEERCPPNELSRGHPILIEHAYEWNETESGSNQPAAQMRLGSARGELMRFPSRFAAHEMAHEEVLTLAPAVGRFARAVPLAREHDEVEVLAGFDEL